MMKVTHIGAKLSSMFINQVFLPMGKKGFDFLLLSKKGSDVMFLGISNGSDFLLLLQNQIESFQ